MIELTLEEVKTMLQAQERAVLEGYILSLQPPSAMAISAYLIVRGYPVTNAPAGDRRILVAIVTKTE